jgi:hypothetical protein
MTWAAAKVKRGRHAGGALTASGLIKGCFWGWGMGLYQDAISVTSKQDELSRQELLIVKQIQGK